MAHAFEAALARMHEALSPKREFDPAATRQVLCVGTSANFMLACGPELLLAIVAQAPRASLIIGSRTIRR